MKFDVIIIGAGASGLMAAIAAGRAGRSVLVLEQKDRAGKKILATGNGKCNFTNLLQEPHCYRSDNYDFPWKAVSRFDVHQTITLFEELGIYPKERDGYLYPNSEQAASVVEVLLLECKRVGVQFAYGEKAVKVEAPKYTIITETELPTEKTKEKSGQSKQKKYDTEKLILSTGGCASSKLGSDGSGYRLAESLGHSLVKPLPALVQLKASDKFLKTLSGVRTSAKVSVYAQDKLLSTEAGEIIFTDYGISGIPILQLSRFAAKALDCKQKVHLLIDFLPEVTKEEIITIIHKRIKQNSDKSIEEMMIGLLNHKLTYILIKEAKLDPMDKSKKLLDHEIIDLVKQIKAFRMTITDTNSFENAQVCSGGVSTKEVDEATMESKLSKNLYLTGELLDVDGTCGGYNLQWAWSSGYLAGIAAGSYSRSEAGCKLCVITHD
ncbi:MAG: hypothetical protein K0S76_2458 [Herbinix sp.]|nr:hypothetical protein [Herbinix sp.]